ncbi:MAG: ribulose-phosphate 3-epimerase [Bacilli bacterium]|nr:ribulose-phosphate 3-epimerase [Bacilli bacterium]
MLVSVSFLKNINGEKQTILDIAKSNADFIHVDIMDGKFVDNKNFTYDEIKDYFVNVDKPLDIHLMVNDVMSYIKDFAKLKPEYITFHIEATDNVLECINYLKDNNIKCGIAINPETSISSILKYLDKIDLVLVMGVHPGYGGQEFIKEVTLKIDELKKLQINYNYIINVDGGVNGDTINIINSDMVVSGFYVVSNDNYNERIDTLRK